MKLTITCNPLTGRRKQGTIEIQSGTTLRRALRQSREDGFAFGYGTLALNGNIVSPKNMSQVLDGRIMKDITVVFQEFKRPVLKSDEGKTMAFDLDSLN